MGRRKLLWNVRLLKFRKFFAVALTISFTLAPISTALAQEAGTDTVSTDPSATSAPTTTTDTTPPPPALDQLIPGVDLSGGTGDGSPASAPGETGSSPAPDAGSDTSQAPSTPAEGTDETTPPADEKPTDPQVQSSFSSDAPSFTQEDISGKRVGIQPDYSSGAYVYKFPIETPPGRNGIEPSLALQYNNLASDNQGSFGYGWSVNVPYIARENKLGTERMLATTSSYFFSSLSGELATTSSSTVFVSRVDDGSFFQYTFSNNKWVVVDKKGVRYTFGTSTLSRQDDPADATRIYKWMLEEIRDTNNNYIKYQYYKDGGQIYPSSIVW